MDYSDLDLLFFVGGRAEVRPAWGHQVYPDQESIHVEVANVFDKTTALGVIAKPSLFVEVDTQRSLYTLRVDGKFTPTQPEYEKCFPNRTLSFSVNEPGPQVLFDHEEGHPLSMEPGVGGCPGVLLVFKGRTNELRVILFHAAALELKRRVEFAIQSLIKLKLTDSVERLLD